MCHYASLPARKMLITFQAKNDVINAFISNVLTKSCTEAIKQIVTFMVAEKGMENKGKLL